MKNDKISAIVERITFHSPETGWAVLKVKSTEKKELITVLIHQAKVFAGATMDFYGQWVEHQKFGRQFKASHAIEIKPASAAALEKYLGSGLIYGVGPKTAKKIVSYFGKETLEVFEEKISELLKVPGIAEKKLDNIKQSWEEHRAIRDIMLFLQEKGVSTLFAVKIFRHYGEKSIELVKSNPYRLAKDIYGIGFLTADDVAKSLGFDPKSPLRISAGIQHILANSREEGHCFLTQTQILKETQDLLELKNEELILDELKQLIENAEIKTRKLQSLAPNETAYYSNTLFWEEDYVARKIQQLQAVKIPIESERVAKWLEKFSLKNSLQLSEEQLESILGIVQSSFSILTGGPGCGKTTTTQTLVKLLQAMKKKVLLAAPTGRAAQRMSEVIGSEAKTIHRLLEWEPFRSGFQKNEESPLLTDFLIIDEVSMLDISLAAALLKAIPPECQVLWIGDPDQLPSVGAGQVLQDIIESKKIKVFNLTQVFRQAEASYIIRYAHQINQNTIPQIPSPIAEESLWQSSQDCLFIDSEEASQEQLQFIRRVKRAASENRHNDKNIINSSNTSNHEWDTQGNQQSFYSELDIEVPKKFEHVDLQALSQSQGSIEELQNVLKKVHPHSTLNYGMTAVETIRRLYSQTLKRYLGSESEIQILSPQVRGSLGVNHLNEVIQESVNPASNHSTQIKFGDKYFRPNDRVIQIRNNYDLGVFNGDIGQIAQISPSDGSLEIKFPEGKQSKTIIYKKENLNELQLAYAITIHKSQGSEFPAVIIPIHVQHFNMLYKNLIYTALTRAKKLAVFVGSRQALAMAITNQKRQFRQTALKELL